MVERDGVTAVVTPSAPTQSILNCVVWRDLDGLVRQLDRLAAAYAAAGVTDWMVWVPPGDAAAAARLRDAGHELEYEPLAMWLELDRLRAPAPGGPPVALRRDGDPRAIATLNERANGEPPGAFGRALDGLDGRGDGRFRCWLAEVEGRPAAGLITFDDGDRCMVQWVATDPPLQRRRVAGRLLHAALRDARARGLRRSVLEASAEGERLYAGLGYVGLGRLGMWRRARPAAVLP